ncbi:MAG TPA: tetratricopeptide repeat protein [Accumulibacter sp.]|jgi:predicted O-linked N-acetylglucosamine transferase (SPINDLY family)|nr:tetratricopeptide repeat protein [Accumulibacter sp.]HQC80325.1 tetratricopeptide repeat protein [Accumulibacter sp.]
MKTFRSKSRTAKVRPALDSNSLALMRLVKAAKYPEIEAAARRILMANPQHSLALKALGFALVGLGEYADALPIIELAVQRHPNDPELHNNLGIVLSALMRWDESLECFSRSLAILPDDPEVLKNCGAALVRMQQPERAIAYLLKAIELYPGDYVAGVEQLANTLLKLNRNDEAWTCLNELWKADDSNSVTLAQLLFASLKRCEWRDFDVLLSRLRTLSSDFHDLTESPFILLSFPGVNSDELRRVASRFSCASIPTRILAEHERCFGTTPESRLRLRVGYLSTDFKDHPVGWILPEMFELHDRSRVEVFGYSIGIDDGSDIRRRLIKACDQFTDLLSCSIDQTAERIRADKIDILVDLNGWTAYGRPEALALRCAPVQVNWLGYAGTFGHWKLADYILGDPVVTPLDHRGFYSETIAQLPGCYLPFDTRSLLPSPPSRHDAGLPEQGFVFCSFNNSYKFNPAVFDLWCRLLLGSSNSFLWLGRPSGSAEDRLRVEVEKRGVDPARLLFAPRVSSRLDHLSRLQLADLALDPFPYNSHSTGAEILWAGVPMVALLGDTFPGRVGASLLHSARLDELIAGSLEEYYEIAIDLVGQPQRLLALRAKLAANRLHCPLFDMPRFVHSLESVYRRMWDNYLRGVKTPLLQAR